MVPAHPNRPLTSRLAESPKVMTEKPVSARLLAILCALRVTGQGASIREIWRLWISPPTGSYLLKPEGQKPTGLLVDECEVARRASSEA